MPGGPCGRAWTWPGPPTSCGPSTTPTSGCCWSASAAGRPGSGSGGSPTPPAPSCSGLLHELPQGEADQGGADRLGDSDGDPPEAGRPGADVLQRPPQQPADAADDLTAARLRQVLDGLGAHLGQQRPVGLGGGGGRAGGRLVTQTGQDRELVVEDLLVQPGHDLVDELLPAAASGVEAQLGDQRPQGLVGHALGPVSSLTSELAASSR